MNNAFESSENKASLEFVKYDPRVFELVLRSDSNTESDFVMAGRRP